MRGIRVKVVPMSFTRHAPNVYVTRVTGKLEPVHSGTYVWIGAPVKPGPTWTCGTDVVWPVLKLEGHNVKVLERSYVCRHMIEIGD
jgi:hypothetical protein